MRWQRTTILGIPLLGLLLCTGLCRAEGPVDLDISPASWVIGVFFSGREVTFSGYILSDRDIVLEIRGPVESSRLVLKRKVGPFWMNREKVEIDSMPFDRIHALFYDIHPVLFFEDKARPEF